MVLRTVDESSISNPNTNRVLAQFDVSTQWPAVAMRSGPTWNPEQYAGFGCVRYGSDEQSPYAAPKVPLVSTSQDVPSHVREELDMRAVVLAARARSTLDESS
jgi:hypothetical protein